MSAANAHRESGAEVVSRSSSAELSSPPRSSREASPSAQLKTIHKSASIAASNPVGLVPAAPPAKKKPGRKAKVSLDPASDAPKVRKPRKPKDPNAPPRKPRKTASTGENATMQLKGVAGLSPPDRKSTPKFAESNPTTRNASFEVHPDTLGSQNGKHEAIPQQSQISSFFAPPQPAQSQHSVPSQ
jgi:hypothetical protein